MRTISVLFFVIIMSVFLISGCGANKIDITESPVASPSLIPSAVSASTQTSPELQSVAQNFIAAQNTQDWSSFLALWSASEQVFYKDFFAYPDNAEKHNGYFSIKSAELLGVFDITQLFKDDTDNIQYAFCDDTERDYIRTYDDYSVVIIKANYGLESKFWDYREGTNYRALILVPENGQRKVLLDLGYPGGAVYFNDAALPEETGNTEEPDNLVDGTVHYTKTITGYYIGLQTGDYNHPGFRTTEGEEIWFWTASDVANYETLSRYQKVEITYENRDKYVDEANSVINMDRITGIKLLD